MPTGDEAKSIQCPICKETLKSEFLEDDEDWVWMNAVRVQGRVSSQYISKLVSDYNGTRSIMQRAMPKLLQRIR